MNHLHTTVKPSISWEKILLHLWFFKTVLCYFVSLNLPLFTNKIFQSINGFCKRHKQDQTHWRKKKAILHEKFFLCIIRFVPSASFKAIVKWDKQDQTQTLKIVISPLLPATLRVVLDWPFYEEFFVYTSRSITIKILSWLAIFCWSFFATNNSRELHFREINLLERDSQLQETGGCIYGGFQCIVIVAND